MVVIANKSGKLGNRIIVFAHFIACALENNVKIMNPAFDEYAGFFRSTSRDLLCRYPLGNTVIRGGEKTRRLIYHLVYYATRLIAKSKFSNRLVETIVLDWEDKCSLDGDEFIDLLKRRRLILAQGWQFRARRYFVKHANEVREFFRPVEAHERKVEELILRVRGQCDVLVGVHIRLGDYSMFKGGKYFFDVDKYVALMKDVEGLFDGKKVGFLICSNESLQIQRFSGMQVFFGTNQPLEDMYALAGCDYILGPPSTFSMWASFYGQTPLYQFEDIDRTPDIDDFKYCVERCAIT